MMFHHCTWPTFSSLKEFSGPIETSRQVFRKANRYYITLLINVKNFQSLASQALDAALLARYLKYIRFTKMLSLLRIFRGSRLFRYSYRFEDLRFVFISWIYFHENYSNLSADTAFAAARVTSFIMCLLFFCHVRNDVKNFISLLCSIIIRAKISIKISACLQFMVPVMMDAPENSWIRNKKAHLECLMPLSHQYRKFFKTKLA